VKEDEAMATKKKPKRKPGPAGGASASPPRTLDDVTVKKGLR